MPVVKFTKENKEIEVPRGANLRQEAIKAIAGAKHVLNRIDFKSTHVKDLFGTSVFRK